MFNLKDKKALVTGATGGIGAAIAKALHAQGAHVGISGRNQEKLEALAKELGERVTILTADLSTSEAAQELVKRAEEQLGGIDILVNNAGLTRDNLSMRMKDEEWQQVIDVNLTSTFVLAKTAQRGMMKQRWGRIINIASAHGLVASPFKSAYVAAKHGVVGLTKVIGLEGAEHNVTANAICPGYVWTPLVEKQIDDQAKAHNISREAVIRDVLLAQQPNKKFATVEEMGALAVFLASDAAGSFVTGEELIVDGGYHAMTI